MSFALFGYGFGFLAGVASSIPVGILGMISVSKTIEEGFASGFSLAVTVAIMDALYCLAAMFGISLMISNPTFHNALKLTSILLLICFGIKTIRGKGKQSELQEIVKKNNLIANIFTVIALYISSPMQIIFWGTVANIVHSWPILSASPIDNISFSIAVGIGAICFYFVLLKYIHFISFNQMKINSHIANFITVGLGYVIIAFALYLAVTFLHEF
jgi:threonine/homoserine/homoserine lactone efflux protein